MVYFFGCTTALSLLLLWKKHVKHLAQIALTENCFVKIGQQDVEIAELKCALAQTTVQEIKTAALLN